MDLLYLNLNENPIKSWKNHNLELVHLTEITLKYACNPITSVSLEDFFKNCCQ